MLRVSSEERNNVLHPAAEFLALVWFNGFKTKCSWLTLAKGAEICIDLHPWNVISDLKQFNIQASFHPLARGGILIEEYLLDADGFSTQSPGSATQLWPVVFKRSTKLL